MKESTEEEANMSIELHPDISEGIYSNLAIINHSNSEFVLDFINVMPGIQKAKVKSRIILTPQNAKRLSQVLADNVKRFESKVGEIKDFEQKDYPINFGPVGEA